MLGHSMLQGSRFVFPMGQICNASSFLQLNLASQSVLEGLNACLDHRGEVFVPELGRSFKVAHGRTHLFGCQNPYRQGGARRGLPRSFLNRFTLLALKPLGQKDLEVLACCLHPSLPEAMLHKMVLFNQKVNKMTFPQFSGHLRSFTDIFCSLLGQTRRQVHKLNWHITGTLSQSK